MQVIKKGISRLMGEKGVSLQNVTGLSTITFTTLEDSCLDSCPEEACLKGHPQLPSTMAKRIDQGNMLGSFKPYQHHILLRGTGSASTWPEKVEDEKDGIVELYSSSVIISAESVGQDKRAMISLFEDAGENALSESDSGPSKDSKENTMYLFPSGHQISLDLTSSKVTAQVSSWLSGGPIDASIINPIPPAITCIVLVCAHMRRDKKCGIAGPLLITEFKKSLSKHSQTHAVPVLGVSHIGGHKYAGNVILYRRGIDGWVADWYGRVKTCHVGALVSECVIKGQIIKELWRGSMDLGADVQNYSW